VFRGRFSPPASSRSHLSKNTTQKVTDTYSLLSTCFACVGPSLLEPESLRRDWHRERVPGCPVTFFIDRSVFRRTGRWIKPHRFPGEIALQSQILTILRPCELGLQNTRRIVSFLETEILLFQAQTAPGGLPRLGGKVCYSGSEIKKQRTR
jgi:hypothetical protein